MASNPLVQPTHLAAPRPYSPSIRHLHNRSPNATSGSATQTVTNTPQRSESPEPLVLRLRGSHALIPDTAEETSSGNPRRRQRPHIQWAEDVIDNEGLGRKKSKVCCIYHKPRPVGESSDESSSDSSSSDSGSDYEQDGAKPASAGRNGRRKKNNHAHDHNGHGDDCGHDHRKPKQTRRPSPNAYEKIPKYDVKPLEKQPGSASGS